MSNKNHLMLVVASLITILFIAPIASAQETSSDETLELRATFRSALLSDPRSASLSEEELEAMVTALSEEAVETDSVSDFVLPVLIQRETIEPDSDEIITPWGQPISPLMLYGVILLSLLIAILLLWWLLHLHKLHAIQKQNI